ARQNLKHAAIIFHDGWSHSIAGAILREKIEQGHVAEVLFQISAFAQPFGIDFRDRQAMLAKVHRELQESGILFPHAIQDSNRTLTSVGQSNDAATRTSQLTLQRLDSFYWGMKILLEKLAEDVHEMRMYWVNNIIAAPQSMRVSRQSRLPWGIALPPRFVE